MGEADLARRCDGTRARKRYQAPRKSSFHPITPFRLCVPSLFVVFHFSLDLSPCRAVLRASVNRSARDYSERQYLVEQQILSIDKLSSVIDGLERDMNGLKMQYEAAVEMRNYTGA